MWYLRTGCINTNNEFVNNTKNPYTLFYFFNYSIWITSKTKRKLFAGRNKRDTFVQTISAYICILTEFYDIESGENI